MACRLEGKSFSFLEYCIHKQAAREKKNISALYKHILDI